MVSTWATGNYTWNDIYLADFSVRFDGSSDFGSKQRWAPFFSGGLGVNIHNYEFLKGNEIVNKLKVRASYGRTGKASFPSYAATTMYEALFDEWYATGFGAVLKALGNNNLSWEKTDKFNVGIEMQFLNRRLTVDADYYHDKTIDLVNDVSLSQTSGFSSYKDNMGEVLNQGFELQVRGLMNVQFAVKDNEVYLIEVNPRAARTVPFVSKATGVPLAKVAARVMAGKSLAEQGVTKEVIPPYYSVKEVVLPFNKFPGVDPLLGPEMRSTGEVMGVGRTFAEAFAKAQLGSNSTMKKHGRALLSVREGDKERVVDLAAKLLKQGFELDATHGTAIVLGEAGINPRLVNKVHEGRPHIQDRIKNGEYTYIINTTSGRRAIEDSRVIRRSALQYKVHYDTTLNGGFATAMALNADATEKVISVQEMHAQIK